MDKVEIEAAKLMFIALLKAASEHATLLTGEFKMQLKQDFNNLVNHCDHLVSDLESRLNDNQKEYLQEITDTYHDLNVTMRKKAVELYKQLELEENAQKV